MGKVGERPFLRTANCLALWCSYLVVPECDFGSGAQMTALGNQSLPGAVHLKVRFLTSLGDAVFPLLP